MAVPDPFSQGFKCVRPCGWIGGAARPIEPPPEPSDDPQRDLFVRRNTHRGDPQTSRNAARRSREFASGQRAVIISVLTMTGQPMTVGEIADRSGGKLTSIQVTRMMSQMKNAGETRASGEVVKNPNGYDAHRWELIP